MDVVIPLFAFLLGLGVYRWVSRLWRAVVRDIAVRAGLAWAVEEVRRETARVDVVLLDAEDAERLRLFGPDDLTEECRHRVGDMVAISLGRDVMRYSRPEGNGPGDAFMRQIGQHSGLSPQEMLIPLIVC